MPMCSTKWKIDERINFFNEDQSKEWVTNHTSELLIEMKNFSGHVG